MKRLGFVAMIVLGMASPAMADIVTFVGGPYQANHPGIGGGGEFTFIAGPGLDLSGYAPGLTRNVTTTPATANTFQSFCLEVTEHVGPANQVYDYTIAPNAVGGGRAGGTPVGDPISRGTGWLYSQFAQGTLAGYFDSSDRVESARLLQQAFWYLEQELLPVDAVPSPNRFLDLLLTDGGFANLTAARANGGWEYGVYALNLTQVVGGQVTQRQSQLYYSVPDGGATLVLLGGALLGLGALRRRFLAA